MNLHGKTVLVIGATGFIGGRLVERLALDAGARVRTLVRNFSRAIRIARFDVTIIPGSIEDAHAMQRAVEGCDVVFNCAIAQGGSAKENTEASLVAATILAESVARAHISRLVHVGSLAVYGQTGDGPLDETSPYAPTTFEYALGKRRVTEFFLEQHRRTGLPVVVIHPTIVYGPYGKYWTIEPIHKLRKGKVVLVDGGQGLCNAVYVDDVVQSLLLASVRDSAVGEAFLISAQSPVTWKEFYGAYESMLGSSRTVSLTEEQVRAEHAAHRRSRELGLVGWAVKKLRESEDARRLVASSPAGIPIRLARRVVSRQVWQRLQSWMLRDPLMGNQSALQDERLLFLPPLHDLPIWTSKTHVKIDKAKRLLGYEPRFDLKSGMLLTEKWLRWANLLNQHQSC